MRVLFVHREIVHDVDVAYEIRELITGLHVARRGEIEIWLCDGTRLYDSRVVGEQPGERLQSNLRGTIADIDWPSLDVVVVESPHPLRHLPVVELARRHRVPIVQQPNALLTDEAIERMWTRPESWAWRHFKHRTFSSLRTYWWDRADAWLFLSRHELDATHAPESRSAIIPWAVPNTALARSITSSSMAPPIRDPDGPVAFVSRDSPYMKGFDRLVTWLFDYADVLPRPAAVLCVTSQQPGDRTIVEAQRRGLLRWDRLSRGADLMPVLQQGRASMLLSRWDGFPRVVREAALIGLPVIVNAETHSTDFVDTLPDAGFVVPSDNPAALHAAFEACAHIAPDPVAARRLLDRTAIGRFMAEALERVADGHDLNGRSYFAAARLTSPMAEGASAP